MTRTVVAIYDNFQTANGAVRDLVDLGFSRDTISIIANNKQGEYGYAGIEGKTPGTEENVADDTGAGAGVGAGIGAAIGGIGGLLVGLGALVIPGIGPVIAAGPLAVALSTLTGAGVGAVAGGVTGGLLGALIGLGIPEDEAEFYAEGVKRGGVLVTIQVDDANTDQIRDVLNRHGPIDIHEQAAKWREQGWQHYDPNDQTGHSTMVGQQSDMIPATGEAPDTVAPDMLNEQPGTWRKASFQNDFDEENPVLQNHYTEKLAGSGYPYDYYVPAYRYGYGLASNARYQNSTWNVIEPDVRRDWEIEHPGTYERFKDAIQYAWQDAVGTGGPNDPSDYR